MHLPASLFDKDNEGAKEEVKQKLLAQLNRYLLDPIEECLATNSDGSLCIEVKSPLDIDADVSLPRGNIFQKDLSMPLQSLPTILHIGCSKSMQSCSEGSRGLSVPWRVTGIFTDTTISPGSRRRQCTTH